ncbi:glucose-6-phosphate dehydrogenase [Chengkuizengella sediminis]|uniref:glucose-6-phosphate dehydrogenase n=1 Tax=Chengkuizengella sediminis TaxID=1885917 RepID=UPI0013897E4C|nr:glucose-6-phosphate dehydrogenase [Chengkuizengella sediminis]NDI36735.1 glucose-6-phosphate dehydrogenase [Chengkuizengella sediminis]
MNNNLNSQSGVTFFIFGATGDLAKRKLYPAIYSLFREGKLSERFAVIGLARRHRSKEEFQNDVYHSIQEFARYDISKDDNWQSFVNHFEYMSLNTNDKNAFYELNQLTESLEQRFNIEGNRLFYLALAPQLFGQVANHLREGRLLQSTGWHRVVIEKPFGYDLKSAEDLNTQIREVFEEEEIYRIDHYLGKEMIQNIEVIRFANAFFEPLWNNKYIANIQITLSETVGVGDRGGYYENSGALRDMAQNHMLQMVAMMAMEPPSRMESEDIRDEKVKVLRSIRSYKDEQEVKESVVRAQYIEGTLNNKTVKAYRDEDSVSKTSNTETFFAAELYVDNFRWAGVPFYVRTGKRLPAKATEVVVEFKNIPENVYFAKTNTLEPNLLVFRVNPQEGIYIKFNAKKPGGESMIIPVAMDFCQSCEVGLNTPEAYERLVFDAIRGDSTYFTRWDEVASAWKYIDSISESWSSSDGSDLQYYEAGTWGPKGMKDLLEKKGFKWWPVHGQEEAEVTWVQVKSEK